MKIPLIKIYIPATLLILTERAGGTAIKDDGRSVLTCWFFLLLAPLKKIKKINAKHTVNYNYISAVTKAITYQIMTILHK